MADKLSNRRNVKEDINIQSWTSFKTTDNEDLLLKKYFNTQEGSYELMLYDGLNIWRESVNKEDFKEKCKIYNPNIEAEYSNLLNHVETSLEECQKTSSVKNIKSTSDSKELTIKSKLQAEIPFSWTFVVKKCDQEKLNHHVLNPLFTMVTELFRRQQELFILLEKKDREIQDYKDQGNIVTRKHLETIPFQRTAFKDTSNIDQDFLASCQTNSASTSITNPGIIDLYRNVMINKQIASVPDLPSAPATATFDTVSIPGNNIIPTVPSWSGHIPESVANDRIDEVDDHYTQQDAPETISPPKNIEQERREALKRRLEQETERKNKKKKKKLKL